ncbi:molybdopterin-dependent oxidoreductase [Limimaricola sp.]|uniref:molybdopterin-dependent oxidoreductase n=1 Tax=Limimaricola sp. TaxID=2211665 RepID=UPI004059EF60
MNRPQLLAAFCLSLAVSTPLMAQEAVDSPGELTLRGDSATTLDLAALKEMPVSSFETSTVWTDGVSRFTGVALADLLASLGDKGTVLRAVARDGYSVEIPVSDAVPGGPIVAYEMDDAPLEADMMGPYWIVYPYDSDPVYRSEEIEARSIWQLDTLELGD